MRKRVEQRRVHGAGRRREPHGVFLGFDLTAEARPGCLGFASAAGGPHRRPSRTGCPGSRRSGRSESPTPSSTGDLPDQPAPGPVDVVGRLQRQARPRVHYRSCRVYGTPPAPGRSTSVDATVDRHHRRSRPTGAHGDLLQPWCGRQPGVRRQVRRTAAGRSAPDKRAEAMTLAVPRPAGGADGLHHATAPRRSCASAPPSYEFTEPTVLAAFAQAQRGRRRRPDRLSRQGQRAGRRLNEPAIAAAAPRPGRSSSAAHHAAIAHNKFIVRAARAADGDPRPPSRSGPARRT